MVSLFSREIPPRLSQEEAAAYRAQQLQALPRICVSELRDVPHLVRCVEGLALEFGDLLAERRQSNDPNATRYNHLLDDILDVLDAVRKIPSACSLTPPAKPEE